MKNMKNIALILALATGTAHAAGTSSAQFLKMGAGARAAAMGNAFAAVSDDVTAGYWNPAGLSQIQNTEVAVMHNTGLVNTNYEYLSAAMPVKKSAIGLSLYSMNYGSIDRYDNSDVRNGSFDAGSLAAAFTFSSQFRENIRWGVTTKYLQESIESESASSFAVDFGAMFHVRETNLAATIQNLGAGMKFVKDSAELPQVVRLGASHKFFNEKLLGAFDVEKYNDNDMTYQTGLDYQVSPALALRGGVQVGNELGGDNSTGLTGGVGINIAAFQIDYAFMPFGDLGNTHRISLLVRFGQSER
jgi:long-subunit fatty acid transport protein